MKKIIAFYSIVAAYLLSGCVASSHVTFNVMDSKGKRVKDAQVYVGGKLIGVAPVNKKMSNFVGSSPKIKVMNDGFIPYAGAVSKELKTTNLVLGILLWGPSLLWCYGPEEEQTIMLSEE